MIGRIRRTNPINKTVLLDKTAGNSVLGIFIDNSVSQKSYVAVWELFTA